MQPGSGGNSVTIMFKEFGVRLSFTPTVLGGDLINLKVRPEVSSLDFSNAIVLQGFRVPALSTRRTDTEVELQDGQTFAIAGLLNNTLNNTMQKIPGIGDIPVLGYLFRSRAYQKNATELVVMITPQIVRRGSTGVSEGLPSLVEPYMDAPTKTYAPPAPYTGSPRTAPNQPQKGKTGGAPQPDAAAPAPAAEPMTAHAAPAATTASPVTAVPPQPERTPQPERVTQMGRTTSPAQQQGAPPVTVAPLQADPLPQLQPKLDAKAAARQKEEARKAAEAQKAADKKAAEDKAVADKKAAEEKAVADKKSAEEKAAADKKAAEDQAVADKKAAEDKERQDKLDKERAKHEAEVAKKNAEADRKKQEDDKKHDKALADAAARLRDAQAAYQAQVDKKKGQ